MTIALSTLLEQIATEPNLNIVFDKILKMAKELTGADAGSYYSVIEENNKKTLRIDVMMNDTLRLHLGGASNTIIPDGANRIPMYLTDGTSNSSKLVVYSVLNNTIINIANVNESNEFDFSATHSFDKRMGYETISILTIPVATAQEKMIGAIQLINALEIENMTILAFSAFQEMQIQMFAQQVATILSKRKIY